MARAGSPRRWPAAGDRAAGGPLTASGRPKFTTPPQGGPVGGDTAAWRADESTSGGHGGPGTSSRYADRAGRGRVRRIAGEEGPGREGEYAAWPPRRWAGAGAGAAVGGETGRRRGGARWPEAVAPRPGGSGVNRGLARALRGGRGPARPATTRPRRRSTAGRRAGGGPGAGTGRGAPRPAADGEPPGGRLAAARFCRRVIDSRRPCRRASAGGRRLRRGREAAGRGGGGDLDAAAEEERRGRKSAATGGDPMARHGEVPHSR